MLDRQVERIPLRTAVVALLASSLLRLIWIALIVITPHTTTGAFLYYLMLGAAGVVLLHWSLGWLGWTISLRAALGARVAPGLTAALIASILGFDASLRAILVLAGVEFVVATWIVCKAAVRPEGWFDTRLQHDEPRVLISDGLEYTAPLPSLVRAARLGRFD